MTRAIWPCFADGFVWCEPTQGFEPTSEVVGGDEVRELMPRLVRAFGQSIDAHYCRVESFQNRLRM